MASSLVPAGISTCVESSVGGKAHPVQQEHPRPERASGAATAQPARRAPIMITSNCSSLRPSRALPASAEPSEAGPLGPRSASRPAAPCGARRPAGPPACDGRCRRPAALTATPAAPAGRPGLIGASAPPEPSRQSRSSAARRRNADRVDALTAESTVTVRDASRRTPRRRVGPPSCPPWSHSACAHRGGAPAATRMRRPPIGPRYASDCGSGEELAMDVEVSRTRSRREHPRGPRAMPSSSVTASPP